MDILQILDNRKRRGQSDHQSGPCPSILKISSDTGIRHLDTEIPADLIFAKKRESLQDRISFIQVTPIRVSPPTPK